MASIEQSGTFHLARRIAKTVAPEFRIFATDQLKPGEIVLDLRRKTIEICETCDEMQAVAGVLFQLGHVRLMGRDGTDLEAHFGKISPTADETFLVKDIIKQGIIADKLASEWATSVLSNTWNMDVSAAASLIDEYVWTEADWRSYYR